MGHPQRLAVKAPREGGAARLVFLARLKSCPDELYFMRWLTYLINAWTGQFDRLKVKIPFSRWSRIDFRSLRHC